MKRLLLLILFLFSCSTLKDVNHVNKHDLHSITHESIIYSHDNEPFDLIFNIQYQINDTNISVDSANVLVFNDFELALEKVLHEHDKRDFFNEDKRERILNKMMNDLWDTEEQYLITKITISDLTESH